MMMEEEEGGWWDFLWDRCEYRSFLATVAIATEQGWGNRLGTDSSTAVSAGWRKRRRMASMRKR